MFEFIDMQPAVEVQESEYFRLLGYPRGFEPGQRARELAHWARQWYKDHGSPWIYARQASIFSLLDGQLRINSETFSSSRLRKQLVDAEAGVAMLAAVSAGRECEEYARKCWLQEKPDEYFFLEVYGSAVVEYLVTKVAYSLCAWADKHQMVVLPHYSPGYPEWDILDQEKLLDIIRREKSHDIPGDLRVMQTGMLNPKKSLLAVFGVTRNTDTVRHITQLTPCDNCSLPACQYRRSPYRNAPLRIENVGSRGQQASFQSWSETSPGNVGKKYSVSERALRKWSEERLQLKILEDQSVEAHFRYDGTTCSNMGRPLEFVYRVVLGAPESGYRIKDADCGPAAGDTGHKYMCEYIGDSASLMQRIRNERPLLGRSLNDVLSWERPLNPAGCYCTEEGRNHKWGLVLEVLHYALREKWK